MVEGQLAFRITGDTGVPHPTFLGHVEWRCSVHQSTVVPKERIANGPSMVVNARRLARKIGQAIEEPL